MITEQQILNKYSEIFRDKDKPMTETCMCWGLEVPNSWLPVIDQLCDCIQNGPCWLGGTLRKRPQVVADQVKEKFGYLRFYYHLDTSDCFRDGDDRSEWDTDERRSQEVSAYQKLVDGMICFAEHLITSQEANSRRTLQPQERPIKNKSGV